MSTHRFTNFFFVSCKIFYVRSRGYCLENPARGNLIKSIVIYTKAWKKHWIKHTRACSFVFYALFTIGKSHPNEIVFIWFCNQPINIHIGIGQSIRWNVQLECREQNSIVVMYPTLYINVNWRYAWQKYNFISQIKMKHVRRSKSESMMLMFMLLFCAISK